MEDFQCSNSITEIAKKILEVQTKNIAVIKNTKNAFLKNRYADLGAYLEVVMPALSECGLILNQFPTGSGLITQITHAESGEFFRCNFPLNVSGKTGQEIGSQISYFRRYSISAILSLFAEDDDNNASSGITSESPTKWLNTSSPEWAGIKSKYKTIDEVKKDFLIAKSVIVELEKIFI